MNTIIPNLSKPYLLDEFLSASDFAVRLFTNNIVGDEENITFNQPAFSGYDFYSINKNEWNVSTLNINYATCTYKKAIVFNNTGELESEIIYGYYVTNSSGEILWYEKFSAPKTIGFEEGIAINIRVNLNKPGGGLNFISLVLSSLDPQIPIKSSSIYILTEMWNDNSVLDSLIDITNRNFNSNNAVFTMLLKSNIVPSVDYPYTFTVLVQSYGFDNLVYVGSITQPGITSFGLTLTPSSPQPTVPPEPPYVTGDNIILYGPYDIKAGLTLTSLSADSNFQFKYLNNANLGIFSNMLIFINNIQVASVDYFSSYDGQPFTLNYETYSLEGTFAPVITFSVPPPGPVPPTQE